MTSSRVILAPLVFMVWMLTSFFCHKLAKMALQVFISDEMTSQSPVQAAFIVTCFQLFCCFAALHLTSFQGPQFYVIVASHVLATQATNTSLALTYASSAMAVKMLEPMTSAVLQAVTSGTAMTGEAVVGMVVVVMGSVMYVGNPAESSDTLRAVVIALVSNVALGARNVAIKHSHRAAGEQKPHFRSSAQLLSTAVCVAIFLGLERAWEGSWDVAINVSVFLALCLGSGLFHVTYSHVSTNVVLRYMSVVGHALANIFKRVLVVLLLHVSGRRSASLWNWAGLALCTVGLLIYNRKKIASSSQLALSGAEDLKTSTSTFEAGGGTDSHRSSSSKAIGTLLSRVLILSSIVYVACVTSGQVKLTASTMTEMKEMPRTLERHLLQEPPTHAVLNPRTSPLEEESYLYSEIFQSNPKHPDMSSTDYALNLRYGYINWTDGKPLLKDPIPFQPRKKSIKDVREFLARPHLLDTPFDTDGLSPYLTTTREVIDEAKRVHQNLFSDLFRGKKYAILFELASFENKGDAALSMGELVMLENMGIKLVFYVNLKKCFRKFNHVSHAMKLASTYSKKELVILFHSGGNIFAHGNVDKCRERSLRMSEGYDRVMMPNSIWLRESKQQFSFSLGLYRHRANLTMVIRDRLSLYIAQRMLGRSVPLVLCPDIAFQNGPVSRFAAPYYDVIWQKRTDMENALFDQVPTFPSSVSLFVWDWLKMTSIPNTNSLRMAANVMYNGYSILQMGRVVVTDRLHGHILCSLMDIPHVLLDNADQKLSAYHNTWTRGIRNCRLADNPQDAARLAMELLAEYGPTLPKRLTAVDIDENNVNDVRVVKNNTGT